MQPPSGTDLLAILRTLRSHEVEFIIVGGVSAVLQGAPVHTFDLDLVHSREPANIERLERALRELDAYYRPAPERRLRPGFSHPASEGHQLLMTRFGPLDLPGSAGPKHTYEDLLPTTDVFDVELGLGVRVLKLEKLIELKEATGQEKDLAVLPVLRRTLAEKHSG